MAQARSGRGTVSVKSKKSGSKKVSSRAYVTVNRGTKRVKAGDTKGHKHQAKHASRRSGRGTLTAPSPSRKSSAKRTTTHRSGRGSISGSLKGTGGKKVSSSAYVTMNRGTKRVKASSVPKGRKVNRRNLRRKSGRM